MIVSAHLLKKKLVSQLGTASLSPFWWRKTKQYAKPPARFALHEDIFPKDFVVFHICDVKQPHFPNP